jgi:hypothetical protein
MVDLYDSEGVGKAVGKLSPLVKGNLQPATRPAAARRSRVQLDQFEGDGFKERNIKKRTPRRCAGPTSPASDPCPV